jgi:hypothetical protein
MDAYRQELAVAAGTAEPRDEDLPEVRNQEPEKAEDEEEPTPPEVQQECPATFGNSDIYGGSYADLVERFGADVGVLRNARTSRLRIRILRSATGSTTR